MTALLDPISADRLAKLCGLFSSEHAGERAVAAAKADALVRSAGLTWRDIITEPPLLAPVADGPPVVWRRMATFCHARRAHLNTREREFVASMLRWRGEMTERQRNWLIDLYARLSGGRP